MVDLEGRATMLTSAAGSEPEVNFHGGVQRLGFLVAIQSMQFHVKVYSASEGLVRISVSATDMQAVREQVQRQGYSVLSVRQARAGIFGPPRRRPFDVALFGQELLSLMEAGMGLVESISLLAQRARHSEVRAVLSEVVRSIGEGQTFSRALEGAQESFPVLFVASVRASERTGNLVEGLRRYLGYHQQVSALRNKVVSASIYPMLLLLVGGMVVLFLMVYVVPRFSSIYAGMGAQDLPLLSRWLMLWGRVASEHSGALVTGALALTGMGLLALRLPASRAALERWLWRLPRVGEQLQIYQLARFTRTVGMLLKGGIPLVTALEMTEALLRQPALRSGLQAAGRALREGQGLAETFRAHGLTTEVGARLLVVGEKSGDLGATMDRIAAFYDEEIARQVEWFTRLFEPVLMVAMGLVIGGIVILMYLPIFQLASSIQ